MVSKRIIAAASEETIADKEFSACKSKIEWLYQEQTTVSQLRNYNRFAVISNVFKLQ